MDNTSNYLLWYCKDREQAKFRSLFRLLEPWEEGATRYKMLRLPDLTERRVTSNELQGVTPLPQGSRLFRDQGFTSRTGSNTTLFPVTFQGKSYRPSSEGDAHASEFSKLGRVPVLKARMNADLHMADDLKNTGKGNLFVIFGEPDIDLLDAGDGQIQVKVNGVDVFHPNTGEIRSDNADGIACWFVDSDYNEESFFVRQAYFLGASDPYKALRTTLKAEINQEAWETLHSDTSRPFPKPASGRIAVKVINHLGDEVMKVFRV